MVRPPRRILPAIIVSTFAGTSLWFAGNAVLPDLQRAWGLPADAVSHTTSSVQLGFIAGTLVFAFLVLSDRFPARRVFLVCSIAGAAANACIPLIAEGFGSLLAFRFLTGFFLAGIYPVAMKIAAGWFQRDLGRAMGWLIASIVVGTAFPQLLKFLGHGLPWASVIFATSAIAVLGGLIMFFVVPDEPAMSSGARLAPGAMGQIFRSRAFRASAFGYFGHMWELYAFWAFVPVALAAHVGSGAAGGIDIALWAFVVIGVGAVGCAWGGVLTGRFGSARVAFTQLAISGACCALSPLFFSAPTTVFLLFLVVWGITVAGDSPQFSTLNARNAPEHLVGSALTVVNCIGFSITIVSIQLLGWMHLLLDTRWIFLFLVLGPVAGLVAMKPLLRERAPLD